MKQITDAVFEAEVSATEMVIVDFYADWCSPCKTMAPVLEQVVATFQDGGWKLEVVKVNIDTDHEKSSSFGIRSIPTLLFFKNGKHVDTMVGAQFSEALTRKITELTQR